MAKRIATALLPRPLMLSIKKRYYLRLIRSVGPDDEPELRIVAHLVRPGDHVLDIGANIGLYTGALSELVGANGAVYSFEPIPPTFQILSSNIRALRLQNVTPVNKAVSDTNATVTMEIPVYEDGTQNFYEARIAAEKPTESRFERFEVETVTLDRSFDEHAPRISFMKIDVEGHELACLKGGSSFLARDLPAIQIEVNDNPEIDNTPAFEVFRLLTSHGYRAWILTDNRLSPRRPGQTSVNYFFLTDPQVENLRGSAPELFAT